jgi:hypothetical protein
MGNIGPWMVCFGIFFVVPLVAFAAGVYVGRNGSPVEIKLKGGGPGDEDVGYG